jgi:hypothetical protein
MSLKYRASTLSYCATPLSFQNSSQLIGESTSLAWGTDSQGFLIFGLRLPMDGFEKHLLKMISFRVLVQNAPTWYPSNWLSYRGVYFFSLPLCSPSFLRLVHFIFCFSYLDTSNNIQTSKHPNSIVQIIDSLYSNDNIHLSE